MKQEVQVIRDSSEKLIEGKLKALVAEGHNIVQIMPLSKTSFIVISNISEQELQGE